MYTPPIEQDLALVRLVGAREHLYKRALAGAVLTQDHVHLAPLELEVHPVERCNAGEALRDATHLQQGAHGVPLILPHEPKTSTASSASSPSSKANNSSHPGL